VRRGAFGGTGDSYYWSAPLAKSDLDGDGVADSNPNGLTYTVTQDGDALEFEYTTTGVVYNGYQEGLRFDVGGSVTTWWDPSDWKGDGTELPHFLVKEVSPPDVAVTVTEILCTIGLFDPGVANSARLGGLKWANYIAATSRYAVTVNATAHNSSTTDSSGRYGLSVQIPGSTTTDHRITCLPFLLDSNGDQVGECLSQYSQANGDWSTGNPIIAIGISHGGTASDTYTWSVEFYRSDPIPCLGPGSLP
jgi:hypothetical protein